MASAFTPQEQAEIRKIARSAAASVARIPWDDAKDQSLSETQMDARMARLAESHEQ